MKLLRITIAALAAALVAGPALAHPGHGADGFAAGALHPVTGLDHLLAMIAVGLWAGIVFRKAWWVWPATFVGFMLAGFIMAGAGAPFPAAEAVIVASVIALGLAAAFGLKMPALAGCAAIAVFATAHGYAHGSEIAPASNSLAFAAGFALSTALLHAVGVALAWAAARQGGDLLTRAAGFGIAAAGAVMLLG